MYIFNYRLNILKAKILLTFYAEMNMPLVTNFKY